MKAKTLIIFVLILSMVQVSYAKEKKQKKKVTLSGYVVDVHGMPIPDVKILVDGETINKTTNNKGFYKIKISPNTKNIMVFSLFHEGLEVDYQGSKKIHFVLVADNSGRSSSFTSKKELQDTGYNIQKLSESTSSASAGMNKNEVKLDSKYQNIFQMITAKFPNVRVRGLGMQKEVIIRGTGSIVASNAAAFVVDGVIVNSINNINPTMVEAISLVKGSQAAIYGLNGANGVIVISTKSTI